MKIDRKEYLRKFQKTWIQKRRKSWLDKNGPCKACSSNERLEVDHIDPLQKTTHRVWSWSKTRRDVELAKCQVLCYKCHKEKTRKFNSQYFKGNMHPNQREYRKELYMDVLKDYFELNISRRKLSIKYDIPQGTISKWIYKSNCQDWFNEYTMMASARYSNEAELLIRNMQGRSLPRQPFP